MDLQELFRACYDLKRQREADPSYDPNVIELLFLVHPDGRRELVKVFSEENMKKLLAEHSVPGDSHPTTDEHDR